MSDKDVLVGPYKFIHLLFIIYHVMNCGQNCIRLHGFNFPFKIDHKITRK